MPGLLRLRPTPHEPHVFPQARLSDKMPKTHPNEGFFPDFATSCRIESRWTIRQNTMPEIVEFNADDVELTPETGFIGFADSANERYFWLQPGETSSGLSPVKDKIWLERDDQQFGGSGGDWKIVLTRDSLTIDTQQLPWMACDKITVRFRVDDPTYHSLKTLLETVMIAFSGDLSIAD